MCCSLVLSVVMLRGGMEALRAGVGPVLATLSPRVLPGEEVQIVLKGPWFSQRSLEKSKMALPYFDDSCLTELSVSHTLVLCCQCHVGMQAGPPQNQCHVQDAV